MEALDDTTPPFQIAALADVAAGDLISAEAVTRWLGGWQIARDGDDDGGDAAGLSVFDLRPPPRPDRPATGDLTWTHTAVVDCDRLRRLLAALDPDGSGHGVRRLGSLLVKAMVRLIAEGADRPEGIADVMLLPTLALRILAGGILAGDGGVIVLGLYSPRHIA